METLLAKLPLVWKLVFWIMVTVGVPGAVSFFVLKAEVGNIQTDLAVVQVESKEFKTAIYNKLEEINRSIGRIEGKLDK